ncbi:Mme1p KNAG_0I00800 [Huiozyma naganishii CBS 8797]|uniref:Mitochondrial carrier protein n=1 Tax=Huiozyma naganishii (strain ATCC MYA-139 / BCRC 22969 / CBS 8797 / KCTC 17520 / NBRC 10181 / NCYC 3082 / Yp74L-3) TaxID=1071383 RepID=J7SA28_HUIN7|nr:hypothetical protein KNAG_0I00800 [Kazachstania naganishii CBS 8797]CCK71871.1 hypothetical protein KNAG_0I00800 [Kazachstania naganishii CBS 8797]
MRHCSSSIPIVYSPDPSPRGLRGRAAGAGGPPSGPPSAGQPEEHPKASDTARSPYTHCMLAGGIGGVIGDSVMHSLDTVKTRQQGTAMTLKYRDMWHAYRTVVVEEGVIRGLYGGYAAAMLGSFPSAAIFFGSYEYTKRTMLDHWQINESLCHLVAGFVGDLVSSFAYVPSEVFKTRLQLQGRYNNTHFYSGYNYRNLRDAIRTIVKEEGPGALFFGYKATLSRDLPFSALQLAFYEKFRKWAFLYEGKTADQHNLSISYEVATGACAGGLAGIITTPLDVVKTRLQTQQPTSSAGDVGMHGGAPRPTVLSTSIRRSLSTVVREEGVLNLFSGVGPRFIWTSVQSSIMLLLYQMTLKALNRPQPPLQHSS